MNKLIYLFAFLLLAQAGFAQGSIERMEPPNWWAGMKHPKVQLLLYGKNLADYKVKTNYKGVRIERTTTVESPNYLFIDLHMDGNVSPGKVRFDFYKNNKIVESKDWELLAREKGSAQRKGFDNTDVLYLITPDRFANGDPSNDEIEGMKEPLNRSYKGGRHGGDIEGIRQHLDYLKEMGFTSIWLNPLLENDMEKYSYHGYSTTDYYKVDPRFGTNEDYQALAKEAKSKGITLIMDMIVNHCGSEHWWMKDLPSADWINQWDTYTQTNHRKSTYLDPYRSESDLKGFTDGWFVPTMPDLNQRNPLMAEYLTQNAIWWIEYLDLAGIRMDTYPYPDMDYMTEWNRRVLLEYPDFNVVGEEWYESPTVVAFWQQGSTNTLGYESNLRSVMDFPVQMAMSKALTQKESWGQGWIDLYEMLAQDFLYADPTELVLFPDNHDMSRIYKQMDEDYDLYKMALTIVCTYNRIPQIYYGTEILMSNPEGGDHGLVRSDFPGGWKGDSINAQTGEGLTEQQKEAQQFIKKLLTWRKTATAIHFGKLMHFVPKDGVYVYFRFNEQQKVMVILNKNEEETTLNLDRFVEVLDGEQTATDILTAEKHQLGKTIKIAGRSTNILELK